MEQQTTETKAATPGADTYSYKGWLISDKFYKRAFAVYGYNFVAGLIFMIPIIIIACVMAIMVGAMFIGGMAGSSLSGRDVHVGSPENTASMKLNINEICENSLIYTTFTDGDAAAAYVEDCKAGKHPEVIENYKNSMGLGDGAAI